MHPAGRCAADTVLYRQGQRGIGDGTGQRGHGAGERGRGLGREGLRTRAGNRCPTARGHVERERLGPAVADIQRELTRVSRVSRTGRVGDGHGKGGSGICCRDARQHTSCGIQAQPAGQCGTSSYAPGVRTSTTSCGQSDRVRGIQRCQWQWRGRGHRQRGGCTGGTHPNSGHSSSYHADDQECCGYGREKPAGIAAGEVSIT